MPTIMNENQKFFNEMLDVVDKIQKSKHVGLLTYIEYEKDIESPIIRLRLDVMGLGRFELYIEKVKVYYYLTYPDGFTLRNDHLQTLTDKII